jgi:hypothetical protein
VYVASFLAQVAQEARKDRHYGAAVTAMVQAAKVAGAYVERTEQTVEFALLEKVAQGNINELSDEQVERFMKALERLAWGSDKAAIEESRRKAGLIEASATPVEPHAESS